MLNWGITGVIGAHLLLYNVSVPSAYPAGFAGLDFTAYGARGTIFDYGLEPSILGEFNFNL